MKALIVPAQGRLEIRDIPEPVVDPYDALVKIEVCGICNSTDHKLIEGQMFWAPGGRSSSSRPVRGCDCWNYPESPPDSIVTVFKIECEGPLRVRSCMWPDYLTGLKAVEVKV